jgi:hypothetical protein
MVSFWPRGRPSVNQVLGVRQLRVIQVHVALRLRVNDLIILMRYCPGTT